MRRLYKSADAVVNKYNTYLLKKDRKGKRNQLSTIEIMEMDRKKKTTRRLASQDRNSLLVLIKQLD